MDNEVIDMKFYIEDDVLVKSEPLCGYNHNHLIFKKKTIITKDAFIACYKKWIELEKEEGAE